LALVLEDEDEDAYFGLIARFVIIVVLSFTYFDVFALV